MKSLMILWRMLALDMGERCTVDTHRDCQTVADRTRSEGQSFLTITLPSYGKAFESWLDQGRVDPHSLTSFRRRKGLPVFLRGFLDLIFDADGVLVDSPSHDAVLAIRQLCGLFGKMHLPSSDARTNQAMVNYIQTDKEVEEQSHEWTPERMLAFSRMAHLLLGRVFDRVDSDITQGLLVPKHGPGATADQLMGNQKFSMHWTWRLEKYFPSCDFLLPNPRYYPHLESVDFLDPGDELPVRVISVPKTQKTPRIIAIEPTCMQYAQQALARSLTDSLNRDSIAKRFIRFNDQEPNQVLAREGSITGALATLDLSEASDRVSNKLAELITQRHSTLKGAVQACRSRQAGVRVGREVQTITLAKFASMGSALCFPMEAMVFLTVVFLGIEQSVGRRLSFSDVESFEGRVAIYGDDIIVPVDHVGPVIHALESFGFKVNSQKSFWTGKFRESCGKDYYDGTDVSYVKFRREWPDDRQSVAEVVSLVSFFNQCNDKHYTQTSTWLRKQLRSLLGTFPKVSRDSAILGEWSDSDFDITRMHKDWQIPETRGYVVQVHLPENPLDGYRALLKWFLKEGEDPLSEDHLLRSGRPSSVSIKMRMALT